jgi:hypothetical protein
MSSSKNCISPHLLTPRAQRNAVAPKKGPTQAETEKSPSGARAGGTLAAEDSMRLVELEKRVLGLEDRCARTMDKLRELRIREASATLLFREMIGILAATERGELETDLTSFHLGPFWSGEYACA